VTTVLISSALVVVVSVVLAALLAAAERRLVRYGTCTIDINRGARRIEVEGGRSLLASLRSQGIFIPSACGGRGMCAYCKVGILEGGGPVAPTEEPLLTPEDRAAGRRISCQVKVRGDMAIEIPEALFRIREFRGVLERMEDVSHDTRLLRIRLVEPDAIRFTPGQYVQLEAPAYPGSPEPVYRAYSIASPPNDSGHIDLLIRRVPGGICTTWVFTVLKEGDAVRFNGPHGEFHLADSDREMVWIAGGSGMAPFLSFLPHLREIGNTRRCTFFLGALQKRDLMLLERLRAAEKELPWFRFVPALSKPAEADAWDGERGLITEVVGRHLENAAEKEGYLCGSAGMIGAAVKVLRAKGVPEERVYYDKFD
jgi:Na+-transporting NADH:ubiquinone oxidoreductase subunit F